jgi:hypothetical protein
MEIIKGKCKVEWVELGEGWSGDYNPNDPEDEELLRFDVYTSDTNYCTCGRKPCACGEEWVDPGDVSYCAAFPVGAPDKLKMRALELIVERLYDQPVNYWKKICEELSWISPDWVKE